MKWTRCSTGWSRENNMDTQKDNEIWQVDAGGKIYDTNFAELTTWIDEGSLLRVDRVRKGNLRWIEAGKVPSLIAVFNAKENGQPAPPPVVTTTKLSPTELPGSSPDKSPSPYEGVEVQTTVGTEGVVPSFTNDAEPTDPVCAMHPDAPAAYVCGTCASKFCKACPNSYGGTVKVCPYCGAMCSAIEKDQPQTDRPQYDTAAGGGFGFGDFARSLAYPFKFKASLVFGAIMFAFFSIGQSVGGFGGIYMMAPAIFCALMANALSFGVLANTVENFAQGRIGMNFMPTFDEFSLWDDVVHPFFLSIGVYISSFGPFIAVCLVAFFMVIGAVNKEMNGLQSDAARSINPDLPYAANAARQSDQIRSMVNRASEYQKRRVEQLQKGQIEPGQAPDLSGMPDPDEKEFERMNQMIQQQRKSQLESVVGKTPETRAAEQQALIKQILGYGAFFLIVGGICLLWGLFYFPAACAVAGYTHSFGATLNPTVGLDTIRRRGLDYVKILLMGLLIVIMSGAIGIGIGIVLMPFNLPGVGNVLGKGITSLFSFYFSVVFSCIIGFALYKASDRLKLPS